MQGELFDPREAELLKSQGMTRAAFNEGDLLDYARIIATSLASDGKLVTADDVQEKLFKATGRQLRNAAGNLFRGKEWQFTGEFRKSRRTANHGHYYRVWRLK